MDEVLRELENEGINIECGFKEKERKKSMSQAMKILKEKGDENKIRLAKRLVRCYGIFYNMGIITTNPNFPYKEDIYGVHCIHIYLENFVHSAKRCIAGVLLSLANDEPLDHFFRKLMYTHFYSPEQIAEIDCEELRREEERIVYD